MALHVKSALLWIHCILQSYLNFQNVPHEIHENLISLNEILEVSFLIQKNELFNSSFFM